ncbi:hypothetical protein AN640_07180 [Candidatus Epulonipiscium fishelsonii]|uniref:Uncharacterized protein n=1 Tax=Candidatus Epulonipiscium fishelsonii TaxID=77094 RepID=A0ACC8XGL3_9FIRM|nr:hypothetical protein AN640_07180 [Epulopiscium sp. SCG-D08WGA-EpuloA1]
MKRGISRLMVLVMFISLLPITVFAAPDKPVIDTIVSDFELLSNTAVPTVTLHLDEPNPQDNPENGDIAYYRIFLTDISDGIGAPSVLQTILVENLEMTEYTIDLVGLFANVNLEIAAGSYYKVDVQAVAQRSVPDPGGEGSSIVSIFSPVTTKYFVTPFDTKMYVIPAEDSTDDSDVKNIMQVTWQYIKDMDYEIYIGSGKFSNPQDLIDFEGVLKKEITFQEAYDFINDRGLMQWNYDDALPGRTYTVVVLPRVPGLSPYLDDTFLPLDIDSKTVVAVAEIILSYFEVDSNHLALNWVVNLGQLKLKEIEVWMSSDGGIDRKMATIRPESQKITVSRGPFEILYPTVRSEYYLIFYFADDDNEETPDKVQSTKIVIDPTAPAYKPASPTIPEPVSNDMDFDKLEPDELESRYLVTGDDIDADAFSIWEHLFHVSSEEDPLKIQLVWDIYKDKNNRVDSNILFDIWVATERESLDEELYPNVPPNFIYDPLGSVDDKFVYTHTGKEIGYKSQLETYYTQAEGGVLEKADLIANETYYIKAVAKYRNIPDNDPRKNSEPTIVIINVGTGGDIFQPPLLGKAPFQIKENSVTSTSAIVTWLESWHEIMPKEPDVYAGNPTEYILAKTWNSVVYLHDKTPYIRFRNINATTPESAEDDDDDSNRKKPKADDNVLGKRIFRVENDLDEFIEDVSDLAGSNYYDNYYMDRQLTIGTNVHYEFRLEKFLDIQEEIGDGTVEEWVSRLPASDNKNWDTINPTDEEDPELDAVMWKEHSITGLKPNTQYIALIRVFRVLPDGTKSMQTFPSYLLFTTEPDDEEANETPTSPELQLEAVTDTTITVTWDAYNPAFTYELVYSLKENINTAVSWDISDLSENSAPSDGEYIDGYSAYVTVNGLFPDTGYYFWVRATNPKSGEVSAWSNPVYGVTDGIVAPYPPFGVGPAALQSLLDIGVDMDPISWDYITVEWVLNDNDKGSDVEGKLKREYKYLVQFADNDEFFEPITVITDDSGGEAGEAQEVLSKNIVQFNALRPNKNYFVRVKTLYFLTNTEIEKTLSAESEFTSGIMISTESSDNEFDGGENENVVEYDKDYDETFEDGVWEYEILNTNKIITDIIDDDDYVFEIDMQLYRDFYDANLRIIKMPKEVMSALQNLNMQLKVVTNVAQYKINPDGLQYYTDQAREGDILQFDFQTLLEYDLEQVKNAYPYTINSAESMAVSLNSDTKVIEDMVQLEDYMQVSMRLENEYDYISKNIKPVIYDQVDRQWEDVPFVDIDYLDDGSYLTFKTPVLGVYALQVIEDTQSIQKLPYSMQYIATQYGIEQLGQKYTQSDIVQPPQFVNLLLGITADDENIDLDGWLSDASYDMASISGLFIEDRSGIVTEQEAVSGVLRLHELRTGGRIKPSNVSFAGVAPAYKENVSKAYAIGLINDIDPTDDVTYEELCDLLLGIGL